ncbi:MAG: prolipoprotein diacylglyceryl transferase family protein, partial [Betaproteobacteria bacterium]
MQVMWMHPQFDPVALSLGPIQVHWYGLSYLLAFVLFMWTARLRLRQGAMAGQGWTPRDVEDLMF